MKFGLIGAGYWGKNLVRVFYGLGVLDVICDLDEKVLEERKKDYPKLKITRDFSDILKDKEIKGVIISSPAATHYKLAKKALFSGKDVFVEKPLALDIEQGKELVRIAKQKRLVLMVGHLLLYHPAVLKLKEIIKSGKLGEVDYIYSNRLNFGKIRKEENVLWSFTPHDISVIIDIMGVPKKVSAVSKSYLQKNIADIFCGNLEFQKSKAAHIFVSWLNPFKEQKLVVIGSKQMAVFDDRAENKLVIYPREIKWQKNQNPEAIKANGRAIRIFPKEPLVEEAKHFLQCIKNRKKPRTSGSSALDVLKILDAFQKSVDKKVLN